MSCGSYFNSKVVFGDSPNIDAFGRLRTSAAFTQFDSKQLRHGKDWFFDTVTSGGATAVKDAYVASTAYTVSSLNDYVIEQTYQHFNYQPGHSLMIMCTADSFNAESGVIKKVGYYGGSITAPYHSQDGLYFESHGDDSAIYTVVEKSDGYVSRVAQTSWNLDKMDGTGASGITADFSKSQIYLIDFEWLGVGRVRFGLVIDGKIYYVHEYKHANNSTSVYMNSPNHQIRYEMRSTGRSGSFTRICSMIASESATQTTGVLRGVDNGVTLVSAASAGVIYPLIALRKNISHLNVFSQITSAGVISSTANVFYRWVLLFNPSISGSLTWVTDADSVLDYAIGDGNQTVTGGLILDGGYATTATNKIIEALEESLNLGNAINGARDIVVLCASRISASGSFLGSIQWREYV